MYLPQPLTPKFLQKRTWFITGVDRFPWLGGQFWECRLELDPGDRWQPAPDSSWHRCSLLHSACCCGRVWAFPGMRWDFSCWADTGRRVVVHLCPGKTTGPSSTDGACLRRGRDLQLPIDDPGSVAGRDPVYTRACHRVPDHHGFDRADHPAHPCLCTAPGCGRASLRRSGTGTLGMLDIIPLVLGFAATNCYLVAEADSGEAVVIDPAWEGQTILSTAKKRGWRIGQFWYTHAHFDHFGGAAELAEGLHSFNRPRGKGANPGGFPCSGKGFVAKRGRCTVVWNAHPARTGANNPAIPQPDPAPGKY